MLCELKLLDWDLDLPCCGDEINGDAISLMLFNSYMDCTPREVKQTIKLMTNGYLDLQAVALCTRGAGQYWAGQVCIMVDADDLMFHAR